MKPLRVLQIISGFAIEGPLGGIERFGIELAQALNRSKVEPIICGLWAYGTPYEYGWVDFLREQGIEAFIAADWDETAPYASFRRALPGIRAAVQGPVDFIHSHTQFGDVAALLLKRPLGARRLLRTVHNEREWGRRPERRLLLTNFLYPLTFAVEIGVAQQVVDNLDRRPLARLLGRRGRRIYNALNLARFSDLEVDRAAKKAELGIPAGAPVIGSIGRLTAQKGYHIFLQAAAATLEKLPQAYFLLVGDGDLAAELKGQAESLGLGERIIFTGPRRDVEALLAIFDLFINSSLWEGLPTVILESMAAGVPVVATAVAGNRELIHHQETGLLVPPDDAAALATAVVDLLQGPPEVRARLATRAGEYAAATFSIEPVAREYEALYEELLGY